ncbi:MAG: hypothetical protein HC880_21340 [Bacteroidia bacterium]|nr:hypothetical protein [Bacteroidia bacterium]
MGLIIKFILGLSLGVVSTASLKAQSEMVSLRTNPEAAAKVPETEVKKFSSARKSYRW